MAEVELPDFRTVDEVRNDFFTVLWRMAYLHATTAESRGEAVLGMVLSMLAIIDGEDTNLSAFLLAPCPNVIDRAHFAVDGCKPFPENDPAAVCCNLGGELAAQFQLFVAAVNHLPPSQWLR
ncbi:MAG: hypothetical protein GY814_00625 [Gammaproteobacteria bacterium]|nr:hypothetical protein [Gammaproteobacteria bacterium]